MRRQELQGNVAVQTLIVRFVDEPHSTRTELLQHSVLSDVTTLLLECINTRTPDRGRTEMLRQPVQ
jgi:hypothetical protein